MECRAATPAGTARAEDPGLSVAREAAEAVPAESVRSERKSVGRSVNLIRKKGLSRKSIIFDFLDSPVLFNPL
ncbi:hypothetical protein [Sporosarcina sp. Te-1]|uniref:hypothetical protein n=1 Tax=Sporosarcina sp. Te-1 TaxID=2818390 RepID=UPI001A9F64A0|nr:hypothetical protein [Sporosarcina sp. Te-1]QTD43561.1 hypothetical protein J3U78_19910 [Sporosarcina sp. Te-1]